ncbi:MULTISPECIES: DNA-3-methyladenine glycosylase I [Pseudomonas]|jgi:3-methyladenine DNA glycosylase Tag|uniref:DNA-3-methyladenine glycosylase I n=3 Tax=cellular organisms TaxID=131567 RepID=A0A9X8EIE0_PSEPU|nr:MULTISPECIES: DNA-3-methyladenine glycosylase I [Pseudomonas]KTC23614.1 3-methyladenine DNA glycosylase [Pseudomonas putida]MCP8347092.1 DNA-3-methyladenine glycosylase I [Pseudomonas sp. FBF18]MCQ0165611.1 DNA-3-methyladenine glycosylase I [Pseudomonas sp. S12(2018)]MDD1957492.1 DNA-3-methyladenine glycosylase I [Pseudomonas sp. 8209]MEC6746459.1 DNA-3-methyladenine glycosylase I [Pseudomonas qingdaonensis]
MRDYQWLHEFCLNRFGSAAALEAHLPEPLSPAQLRQISDDRYLSTMALRVFRAGLKHSLVDAKWPAFEQVFFGFDPEKVVLMGAEHLERLMQDTRIIRHLGKLKSVPRNAQFMLDVAREKGSFGALIADWPVTDIVGLWKYLAKQGNQMGGLSAPRFLRMVGKDTFVPSNDVVAALVAQDVIDRQPTSQRDLATVQQAFNQWHAQSGRPMCQLSMMLAYTVNH